MLFLRMVFVNTYIFQRFTVALIKDSMLFVIEDFFSTLRPHFLKKWVLYLIGHKAIGIISWFRPTGVQRKFVSVISGMQEWFSAFLMLFWRGKRYLLICIFACLFRLFNEFVWSFMFGRCCPTGSKRISPSCTPLPAFRSRCQRTRKTSLFYVRQKSNTSLLYLVESSQYFERKLIERS